MVIGKFAPILNIPSFSAQCGESTDIVSKEMYTFLDRGKRSLTLRPEATASTVRAFRKQIICWSFTG